MKAALTFTGDSPTGMKQPRRTFLTLLSPIPCDRRGSGARQVRWTKGCGERDPRKPRRLPNLALDSDTYELCQRRPARHVRRPLPTSDVRSGRLGASDRRHDLGERHNPEPRQNLPPEQLRVVDSAGVGLIPFRQRPLASRRRGGVRKALVARPGREVAPVLATQ